MQVEVSQRNLGTLQRIAGADVGASIGFLVVLASVARRHIQTQGMRAQHEVTKYCNQLRIAFKEVEKDQLFLYAISFEKLLEYG